MSAIALHPDIDRVLVTETQIQNRVHELGNQISHDYRGNHELFLVGVLKGCLMFMVDLVRSISLEISVCLDFIAISSYGESTASSGEVQLIKDLETNISGRHVLIVEDIVDSGLTLAYLHRLLCQRKPASLNICVLLNKPERRMAEVPIAYLGFDIPNEFVVGYGLDFAERYRNLPYIGVLKSEVYQRRAGRPMLY